MSEYALGIARDALPVASTAAHYGFDAAKGGTAAGFGVADAVLGTFSGAAMGTALGVAALGTAGVVSAPVVVGVAVGATAVKLTQWSVGIAGWAVTAGLSFGQSLTTGTLDSTEALLGDLGVPEGTTVRLAFGNDAGEPVWL